jgi:hypothetical protein
VRHVALLVQSHLDRDSNSAVDPGVINDAEALDLDRPLQLLFGHRYTVVDGGLRGRCRAPRSDRSGYEDEQGERDRRGPVREILCFALAD